MTSVHVHEIIQMVPDAEKKVVLLKHLRATEVEPLAAKASRAQRLEALLTGRRPRLVRAHDVDDPMGMPVARYRRTVAELSDGIERLADVICVPDRGARPADEPRRGSAIAWPVCPRMRKCASLWVPTTPDTN